MATAEILGHLALQDASPEQWAALVEQHGPRLWAVSRTVAGRELADDAFHDGLIAIRRHAGRFRPGLDPESSAIAWMVTVTYHAACDLVRREHRHRRREAAMADALPFAIAMAAPEHDPDQQDHHASELRTVMAALAALPERHREVIRLSLLGGLPTEETAAVLGCPLEQVRVRLHRALEQLRNRCAHTRSSAFSVVALEALVRHASTPPAALPTATHHLALAAWSTPLAAGLSTGAIMSLSAIGLAAVTACTALALTLHALPMPAAEVVTVDATTAPAPAAASVSPSPAPALATHPAAVTPASAIQAVVAAVRTTPQGQQDLVMLTLSQPGTVATGCEFVVYRGNRYITKVRAERVLEGMIACRVMPESWNTNQLQIMQGDQATNRL